MLLEHSDWSWLSSSSLSCITQPRQNAQSQGHGLGIDACGVGHSWLKEAHWATSRSCLEFFCLWKESRGRILFPLFIYPWQPICSRSLRYVQECNKGFLSSICRKGEIPKHVQQTLSTYAYAELSSRFCWYWLRSWSSHTMPTFRCHNLWIWPKEL